MSEDGQSLNLDFSPSNRGAGHWDGGGDRGARTAGIYRGCGGRFNKLSLRPHRNHTSLSEISSNLPLFCHRARVVTI